MTSEKCDKCGGKTTRGRHHKHCRSCVNCTECGWSNTHNIMFKDYTPWMGYGAEGNPKKTTSTIYANFYVGHSDKKGELAGNGKFKKYDDALAKAKEVAKKEGHSRIVSPRGFALWTSDGKGLFQAGKSTAEAREFYRAEDGSINMNGYATEYMEAEDMYFSAPPHPLHPTRPSDDYSDSRDRRRRRPKRGFSANTDLEDVLDLRQDKRRIQLGKRKAKGMALRNIRKEKRLARKRAEGDGRYYDTFMESRTTMLLALVAGVAWGGWISKSK